MKKLISILWLLTMPCLAQSPMQFFMEEMAAASRPKANGDVVTDGLVAWWKLDDAALGTVKDSAGNNNGTNYSGTATNGVNGVAGTAYYLNNAHLDCTDSSAMQITGALTIAIWHKPTNLGNSSIMVGKDGSAVRSWLIQPIATGKIYFDTWNAAQANSEVNSGLALITNSVWRHITCVFNPSSYMKIYLDGLEVASNSTGIGANLSPATGVRLWIGGRDFTGFEYYEQGLFDSVRLYNRAITSNEVWTIYNAEKP